MEGGFEGRVYRRALRQKLGWSESWYGIQQKRGVIPVGHRDAGGRREWFLESEARAIIECLTRAATEPAPRFAVVCKRHEGDEREFEAYADRCEAEGVANRLSAVGCSARVVERSTS